MKRFFKQHLELVLLGFALLLIGILGFYFFWGVSVLLTDTHESLKVPSVAEQPVGFDIESAKALNLKLE